MALIITLLQILERLPYLFIQSFKTGFGSKKAQLSITTEGLDHPNEKKLILHWKATDSILIYISHPFQLLKPEGTIVISSHSELSNFSIIAKGWRNKVIYQLPLQLHHINSNFFKEIQLVENDSKAVNQLAVISLNKTPKSSLSLKQSIQLSSPNFTFDNRLDQKIQSIKQKLKPFIK